MGGGSSKYKIAVVDGSLESIDRNIPQQWLALPSTKVIPLKADSFSSCGPIGKGKFGFVFLAKHHQSGKHVAIKYISKNFILESKSNNRIQKEAEVVQKLEHPFIVHCFGGFETDCCLAFVFEFASGGELYTFMKKSIKLSESEAKFYFCEIALALHYLHDTLGIVYRDLKPENILIDWKGHAKLCDFGFAVQAGLEDGHELHDGCGTAMYVAPEIAGGFMKMAHSFPVDWWSLGVILVEMVTGRAPFGDTDSASKFEIFNNITQRNLSLPYSMSSSMKALVRQLLDKDPAKRIKWTRVKSSEWCADVSWEDFISCRVRAPWLPVSSPAADSSNFMKWSFDIPDGVSPDAAKYCAGIVPPKVRSSFASEFDLSGAVTKTSNPTGGADATASPSIARKNSLSRRPSEGGLGLTKSPSAHLKKTPSKL